MIFWRTVSRSDLEPNFVAAVHKLLDESEYSWVVTSGYRGFEEQNRLYGQGRREEYLVKFNLAKYARPDLPKVTNAKAGESAHNFGLAIDVVLDGDPNKPGLQPLWDINHKAWIWLKFATLKNPKLEGGWKFGDWPHIQRYQWQSYINWRSNTPKPSSVFV